MADIKPLDWPQPHYIVERTSLRQFLTDIIKLFTKKEGAGRIIGVDESGKPIRLENEMTDTERLDWLQHSYMNLVCDDQDHWACVIEGMQNLPENPPDDIQTTFFIEKAKWKKTVREAIDAAILEEDERNQKGN